MPRCSSASRREYGVDRYLMLGAVGHGVRLRRRGGEPQAHAPGDSGARGAGLGRAAPARLLGAGAAQRARHRRARLGQRRAKWSAHGPAPWATPSGCRRSGSTWASTSTATAASRPSARRTTRLPGRRNTSSSAAAIGATKAGATRCGCRGREDRAGREPSPRGEKLGVTRANGQPFPRPEEQARIWQPVSAASLSDDAEFPRRAVLQPGRQLYARDRPPRRPHSRRGSVRATISRWRAHSDAGRSARAAAPADGAGLQHRRCGRPHWTRDRRCRAGLPDQGRHETCRRLRRPQSAGAAAPGK